MSGAAHDLAAGAAHDLAARAAHDLAARAAALVESPAVVARRAPAADAWAGPGDEPADLAALYAVSGGLSLADGTTLLPRGELAGATAWLVQDRSLDWPDDLLVVGERHDLVLVLDRDLRGQRAGGGVLEAPNDGLASFQRITRSVLGYLERRAGVGPGDPGPELLLAEAAARRDAAGLAAALTLPRYPGSERQAAHAALVLGGLRGAAGDEAGAMEAFEQSVAARVRAAARGAGEIERAAGWRAAAAAAREAGATALVERCAARAAGQR